MMINGVCFLKGLYTKKGLESLLTLAHFLICYYLIR